jgi:hypothetical protein
MPLSVTKQYANGVKQSMDDAEFYVIYKVVFDLPIRELDDAEFYEDI